MKKQTIKGQGLVSGKSGMWFSSSFFCNEKRGLGILADLPMRLSCPGPWAVAYDLPHDEPLAIRLALVGVRSDCPMGTLIYCRTCTRMGTCGRKLS